MRSGGNLCERSKVQYSINLSHGLSWSYPWPYKTPCPWNPPMPHSSHLIPCLCLFNQIRFYCLHNTTPLQIPNFFPLTFLLHMHVEKPLLWLKNSCLLYACYLSRMFAEKHTDTLADFFFFYFTLLVAFLRWAPHLSLFYLLMTLPHIPLRE